MGNKGTKDRDDRIRRGEWPQPSSFSDQGVQFNADAPKLQEKAENTLRFFYTSISRQGAKRPDWTYKTIVNVYGDQLGLLARFIVKHYKTKYPAAVRQLAHLAKTRSLSKQERVVARDRTVKLTIRHDDEINTRQQALVEMKEERDFSPLNVHYDAMTPDQKKRHTRRHPQTLRPAPSAGVRNMLRSRVPLIAHTSEPPPPPNT